MNIIKRLCAILVAALFGVGFSACEYQSSEEADEEYEAELEEIYDLYGEEGVVFFEETGEWPDW